MLSELPQVADIVRSVFHYSASPLVLRITAFGSEQFHGELWPNNATRLSRIDWLWSAKRASVWVTGGGRRRVNQVASNEELHAAPLSGKRLLALWNALPDVEKRRKVGDRGALIDQLWSAIETLPEPEPPSDAKRPSKQDAVIAMLRRGEGATVEEVARATGWQRHTVRGVFSGTLKKKLGLSLASVQEARGRVYRIAEPASV